MSTLITTVVFIFFVLFFIIFSFSKLQYCVVDFYKGKGFVLLQLYQFVYTVINKYYISPENQSQINSNIYINQLVHKGKSFVNNKIILKDVISKYQYYLNP